MKKVVGYVAAAIFFLLIVLVTVLNIPFRTKKDSLLDSCNSFFPFLDLRDRYVHWVFRPVEYVLTGLAFVVLWSEV